MSSSSFMRFLNLRKIWYVIIFHRKRDSIEAHLTVVFAALAITRFVEAATGISIKKLIHILAPLRTGIVSINSKRITVESRLTPKAKEVIKALDDWRCGS